jgi:hypothetical protein
MKLNVTGINGVPEVPGLEINLHQQRPVVVVGLHQHWVVRRSSRCDDALNDDVPIAFVVELEIVHDAGVSESAPMRETSRSRSIVSSDAKCLYPIEAQFQRSIVSSPRRTLCASSVRGHN